MFSIWDGLKTPAISISAVTSEYQRLLCDVILEGSLMGEAKASRYRFTLSLGFPEVNDIGEPCSVMAENGRDKTTPSRILKSSSESHHILLPPLTGATGGRRICRKYCSDTMTRGRLVGFKLVRELLFV